jgi:hypothetical protein
MIQEVQVILTLQVDCVYTVDDIKQFFLDTKELDIVSIEVKEEKDIYKNE